MQSELNNSPHAEVLTSPLAEALLSQKITSEKFSSVFILCDEVTFVHCLPVLKRLVPETQKIEVLCMPEGERNKSIETCAILWKELSVRGADRNSLLINLGGGVVTDLGGFVASVFKRGIAFINVPTSLLAMVDASVGGKTGVDLGVLKNQIGVIQEPEMVLILPEFLQTLPHRHLQNGMVEMLKHGLIADREHWSSLSLENSILEETILHSISIKRKVVLEDPTEKGLRKILNFGHTLGHAIESFLLNHPERSLMLHGEAVAIGMVLEAYLSHRVCGLSLVDVQAVRNKILSYFERTDFSSTEIDVICSLMQHDKKNHNGNIRFALLNGIGEAAYDKEVNQEDILAAFDYYKFG